jgi:hypothetical protein
VTATEITPADAPLVAYKGFNPDWTCRGHQVAIGQTDEIRHVFAGIAGRDGVEPDRGYHLGDDGALEKAGG